MVSDKIKQIMKFNQKLYVGNKLLKVKQLISLKMRKFKKGCVGIYNFFQIN